MVPFGGLSLALRGWEVFQKQTDRCSDTQTDVRTHRQIFGHTETKCSDGQTNRQTDRQKDGQTFMFCPFPIKTNLPLHNFKTKHIFGILMAVW